MMQHANYDRLKAALLKRYNLTEQGYREKFRKCRPEKEESPEQYIFRMQTYLEKWIELSKSEQSYEGLRDFIVKEQVIDSCPKDLGIHLLERAPADLKELAQLADQYLKAHGKQLYRELKNDTKESKEKRDENFCTNCKKPGHKTAECRWLNKDRNNSLKCFNCDKYGHIRNDCPKLKRNFKTAVAIEKQNYETDKEKYSACCIIPQETNQELATSEKIQECIRGDKLLLHNGQSVSVVTNVCQEKKIHKTMPVMKGRIGEETVTTLRDTGCSGAVVKQKFVKESQYTGRYDNTLRKAPIVRINVRTPYYCGDIEAISPPDDLIIGNIEGARAPNDPDTNWDEEEIEKMNQREENMNGKATTEKLTSENLTTEKMTVASAITKD